MREISSISMAVTYSIIYFGLSDRQLSCHLSPNRKGYGGKMCLCLAQVLHHVYHDATRNSQFDWMTTPEEDASRNSAITMTV